MLKTRVTASVYECPADGASAVAAILAALAESNVRVRVQMYALTHHQILLALEGAHQRGVDVKLLLDRSQMTSTWGAPVVASLQTSIGAENVLVGTAVTGELLHVKRAAIDGKVFIEGSLNWTVTGPRESNSLVICTNKTLAASVEADFDAVWAWNLAHQ